MAARHDRTTDPRITESLLLARRGTAYFSRHLAHFTAEGMREPSLIPGWDRAHVVAHVGYHARALANLIGEVRTGTPMGDAAESGPHDVDYGATLPDAALRNLHAHAAVHLNVEWRDLPAERWNTVITRDGQPPLKLADTVWERACEVWGHAVDLNGGARLEDFPPRVLERLSARPRRIEKNSPRRRQIPWNWCCDLQDWTLTTSASSNQGRDQHRRRTEMPCPATP